MKIAFMMNEFSLRGTSLTMFGYALFNKTILNNESIFVIPDWNRTDENTTAEARALIEESFETHVLPLHEIDRALVDMKIDACVVANSGGSDNFVPSSVPTIVQCAFRVDVPMGTVHTAACNYISRGKVPVLPCMLLVATGEEDMREELGIPRDAVVYGRYGGYDQFDIPFVKETVLKVARENPSTYFLMMNTHNFGDAPNIRYLDSTANFVSKRKFINTCDAMLHARNDGETFGIACGEFAVCGKPIVTSGTIGDRGHLDILGDSATMYTDADNLYHILTNPRELKPISESVVAEYTKYFPDNVMAILKAAIVEAVDAWTDRTALKNVI